MCVRRCAAAVTASLDPSVAGRRPPPPPHPATRGRTASRKARRRTTRWDEVEVTGPSRRGAVAVSTADGAYSRATAASVCPASPDTDARLVCILRSVPFNHRLHLKHIVSIPFIYVHFCMQIVSYPHVSLHYILSTLLSDLRALHIMNCALIDNSSGGSVAEWLACWTQAQKGLGSNHSHDAVG